MHNPTPVVSEAHRVFAHETSSRNLPSAHNAGAAAGRPVTSRRSFLMSTAILTSLASAAVVASPSIAAEANQDAELVALGTELEAALAVYHPLRAKLNQLADEQNARNPRPREIITVRSDDVSLLQLDTTYDRVGEEFLPVEIENLRTARFVRAFGRAPRPGETGAPIDFVEDQRATQRATEIIDTYDRFIRRAEEIEAEFGGPAIEEKFDEIYDQVTQLVRRISDIPAARTLQGISVKAKAAAWCREGDDSFEPTTDERLAWGIVRDLVSMSADLR